MNRSAKKRSLHLIVLLISLLAFLARGLMYWLIGSNAALILAATAAGLMIGAYFAGQRILQWAVRLWGIFLILYALSRYGLAIMLAFIDVGSPHASENTGLLFLLYSTGYLVAGVYLVRTARRF